jgi:hypothetical protein
MTLIIGSVLPLRDRIYAKAVVDEREGRGVYDRVMEGILRLPHGSVVDFVTIYGGGSGAAYMFSDRCVRCDGAYYGLVYLNDFAMGDDQPAPEEIQESGVWVVRQANDGFRAVAYDPDAESIEDVLEELQAMREEEGTVAGLPPLSMIEVHGQVDDDSGSGDDSGRATIVPPSPDPSLEGRAVIVIGEDGRPWGAMLAPGGGGDGPGPVGPIKKAGSPGEALKAMLARRHAGKDLEDAERKRRGSRWRSPCPRPGSCR